MEYDFMFKIVVTGSSGVGKTNLVSRFTRNEFRIESQSTIGVEFSNKHVRIEGSTVRCQIWDTAGQERFRAITKAYYHACLGALLVFSITSRSSFESLSFWLDELRENSKEEVVVVLVGNKVDLASGRQVSEDDTMRLAREWNCPAVFTSAKTNQNVHEVFEKCLYEVEKSNGNIREEKSASQCCIS